MKRKLLIDVFVLLILMGLASIYAVLTNGLYAGKSIFVGAAFTIPPTIYLGLRKPKNWKKIFAAVLLFGFILGFGFSFFAEYTKSWEVVSTIFSSKVLGVHTFDTTLGIAFMTLLTVTFYEHFIEEDISKPIQKRFYYSLACGITAIIVLLVIFSLKPTLLQSGHPYLYAGIAAILPVFWLSFRNPALISKMTVTTIYFFFLYLVIEWFAVTYHYWIYPGHGYIGWVTFMGATFPFEELFFWMLFYAASVVSYYEILIDDEK